MGWFCFFMQKTAYEDRISDWSSDLCSSDLVVADIDPQPAGVGLAPGKHRHRGVVAMQPRGGQHMCLEAAEQRHQRRGGGTHLVGQSGEAERHALVSSDFVNCPPWRHEELTPSDRKSVV